MKRRSLNKLRREIDALRRSPQKARALENVAKRLGRKRVKRGKEPTWESQEFAELYPLAVPHHGGRDLAPGTKNSILDQLEDDLLAWEARLTKEEEQDELLKLENENDSGSGENNGTV